MNMDLAQLLQKHSFLKVHIHATHDNQASNKDNTTGGLKIRPFFWEIHILNSKIQGQY